MSEMVAAPLTAWARRRCARCGESKEVRRQFWAVNATGKRDKICAGCRREELGLAPRGRLPGRLPKAGPATVRRPDGHGPGGPVKARCAWCGGCLVAREDDHVIACLMCSREPEDVDCNCPPLAVGSRER